MAFLSNPVYGVGWSCLDTGLFGGYGANSKKIQILRKKSALGSYHTTEGFIISRYSFTMILFRKIQRQTKICLIKYVPGSLTSMHLHNSKTYFQNIIVNDKNFLAFTICRYARSLLCKRMCKAFK